MSGLPEQAVDERVLALIHECGQVVRPRYRLRHDRRLTVDLNDVYHCGCELRPTPRGDLWFLCQYHDGVNDGLAIADGAGS